MSKSRYPTAFCKDCGEPIHDGDGKVVNKKGEWSCTACLIEKDKSA